MTTVRIKDFRGRPRICPDAKDWFEEAGLDWKHFVLNGIDAETLLEKGREFGQVTLTTIVVKRAEARENGQK